MSENYKNKYTELLKSNQDLLNELVELKRYNREFLDKRNQELYEHRLFRESVEKREEDIKRLERIIDVLLTQINIEY